MNLPETTTLLLRAVQASRECGRENYRANTVEISDAGIICYPVKSKWVSREIEQAGIADKVACFIFERTRHLVEKDFRRGRYDVSGNEIRVLE